MHKRKLGKNPATSPPESFGECPECCNGDIILHKSKDYFICTKRLEDGSCVQTFDRSKLKIFGLDIISEDLMRDLLADEVIIYEKFLQPRTGEPLDCECRVYLKRRRSKKTGNLLFMPHVKILWNEKV